MIHLLTSANAVPLWEHVLAVIGFIQLLIVALTKLLDKIGTLVRKAKKLWREIVTLARADH